MLESLRFNIIYLALFTGIVGLFYSHKLPGNKAKSLLYLVFFSATTEFVGLNISKWTGFVNYFVFNFYILVSFSYYIILLRSLVTNISYRIIANIGLLIFIFFYIGNIIFIQKNLSATFAYSFALGVLIVLVLSSLYLIEIFNSKQILNFKRSVFFWFILGILLFHVPFLPFMLAIKWFLIESNEAIYSIVLFILNLLMYFSFTIGFIWSDKKYNY